MAARTNPRREAFAQCMAEGLDIVEAGRKAGFKDLKGNIYKVANDERVQAKIEKLRGNIEWSGTRSVAPLLEMLRIEVAEAATLKTAAGKRVVLDMISKAADLKLRLPPDPVPESEKPRSVTLSVEEWSRQFSPRG